MIDFQNEVDKMPEHLRTYLNTQPDKRKKEEMVILYTIETNFDEVEEVLKSIGYKNPKGCKKCYGRYYEGFKYPYARMVDHDLVKGEPVVVLCSCIKKLISKRLVKLDLEWEKKNEEGRDETTTPPIRPASKAEVDRGKEDQRRRSAKR